MIRKAIALVLCTAAAGAAVAVATPAMAGEPATTSINVTQAPITFTVSPSSARRGQQVTVFLGCTGPLTGSPPSRGEVSSSAFGPVRRSVLNANNTATVTIRTNASIGDHTVFGHCRNDNTTRAYHASVSVTG